MRRSPSELASLAVGRAPVAMGVAEHDTQCALCGVDLPAGSPTSPTALPSTWVDVAQLALPGGRDTCPHCYGLWLNEAGRPLTMLAKAVITERGAFRAASFVHRRHLTLHPPQTPFVWVHSAAQRQHLVWLAPINYGTDVIRTLHGRQVLTWRRQRVIEAAQVLEDHRDDKGRLPVGIDPDMEDPDSGRPRRWAPPIVHDLMRSLTRGELWALCPLVYQTDKQAEQPPLINL